jgi:hypothetical protein
MAKTAGVGGILADFQTKYQQTTPKKIKLIDGFLAYVLATGILQFIYCVLVGTFPFNSFLAGFVCTVGVFVLGGTCCAFWRCFLVVHELVLNGLLLIFFHSVSENADQSRKRIQGPQ